MIDWDDAFDNMGYAEGASELPAQWASAAGHFRDKWRKSGSVQEDIAYGSGPRERLDLFAPTGDSTGLVIFVHGGYWRRFDKSDWSHLAEGCLNNGWSFAFPSYPLAPDARIGEMTACIAQAVTHAASMVDGPIRLAGHSAGGHLVARMMCQSVLPADVSNRLARVVSISGLHALEPLLLTQMNDILQLTEEEAQRESPANLQPLEKVSMTAWVGAQERPEFLRQTRLIEEIWARAGADISAVYDPSHNHFTVIEALSDAHSALVAEILR